MFYKLPLILSSAFLLGSVLAQDDCPCTLESSTTYPGTLQWNCISLGLVSVPGQCYDIESNVTELLLSDNTISQVRNIDLAGLFELRALYVDTNALEYFDPTALDGIDYLEKFHVEHNTVLQLPQITLRGKAYLKEVNLVGSHILNLPILTDSPILEKLDARSCELSNVPRPLFANLTSTQFLLNLYGNSIIDLAADSILPIPAGATINFDSYTTIWAIDDNEATEIINKNWVINVSLDTNLRVCQVDGDPTDATVCTASTSSLKVQRR